MKSYFKPFLISLATIFCMIAASATVLSTTPEQIKKDLPKLLGSSGMGNEFWFTIPPPLYDASGGSLNNNLKIYVTSESDASVKLEIKGRAYTETKSVKAYELVEFDIDFATASPWLKTASEGSPEEKVLKSYGIHITSTANLLVYAMVYLSTTTESFLVLPVSALGTNYIVSSYNANKLYSTYVLPSLTTCVAAYDNTTVRFTVGGTGGTETTGGAKVGSTVQKNLSKGDVLVFAADVYNTDLTGSVWSATKPIAVVSGHFCANVPITNTGCSYIAEMDLPTYTWGKNYYIATIPEKKNTPVLRIFSKETNTTVYRNGEAVASIAKVGGKINDGWIDMRLLPITEKKASALISGDKPIGVTLYNTCKSEEDNSETAKTDPFSVVQTPVEQYLNEVVYMTPGTSDKTMFSDNYLNLIYETDSNHGLPDDIEYGYVESNGSITWKKLKDFFPTVGEILTSKVNGKEYAVKNFTLPNEGVYKFRANNPFNLFTYGYNSTESYAHPVYAGLKNLEMNDTEPPRPIFTFCACCGTFHSDAIVRDMPDDAANRSNLAAIVLDAENSYNYAFTHDEFIPGTDREAKWNINVVDLNLDAKAIITFVDKAGNDTTITLNYYAYKMSPSVTSLDWGSVGVNEEVTKTLTISNNSSTSPLDVTRLDLKDSTKEFEFVDVTLPFSIPANSSKTITVKFKASTAGTYTDSVGIGDTCHYYYYVALKAVVGVPVIEVSDIDFGTATVGADVKKTFTIKNTGSADLSIFDYNLINPQAIFAVEPKMNTDIKNPGPLVISPGSTVSYYVIFKPGAEGTFQDKIIFYSNAGSTDSICVLNGKGGPNGVDDNRQGIGGVTVVPNPAVSGEAVANIATAVDCMAALTVYNSLGTEVFTIGSLSLRAGMNPVSLDLSSLPSGTYYLMVNTGNKTERVKFFYMR